MPGWEGTWGSDPGAGTALAVALAGVPLLAVSMVLAARGSARAILTWLGAAAFTSYNSVMLLFATPFNRFFPLYAASLALSAWSVGTLLAATDAAALARRFAVDQAYGHAADPASPVASAAMTPAFAVVALIGLIPLCYLLRNLGWGQPKPSILPSR